MELEPKEQKEEVTAQGMGVVALPGGQLTAPAKFDMAPQSLGEVMELANMMAKSTIIPKDYAGNPGNVLIAIQWGMELGLKPLQAMQNIAIINGRPSLWGDAVLAIVRAAVDTAGNKVLEGISETFDEATVTATCEVKRRGSALPVARKFSHADAVKAGLIAKGGVWVAYEKRMLQMRARSWALRDEFTDVLRGMPVAEEVMDYTPPEKDVTPLPTAAPAESKAERLLRERQGKEAKGSGESPFTVTDIVKAFDNAKTKEELASAVDLARSLKRPEDQSIANSAYKRAKDRLIPAEAKTATVEDTAHATGAVAG